MEESDRNARVLQRLTPALEHALDGKLQGASADDILLSCYPIEGLSFWRAVIKLREMGRTAPKFQASECGKPYPCWSSIVRVIVLRKIARSRKVPPVTCPANGRARLSL